MKPGTVIYLGNSKILPLPEDKVREKLKTKICYLSLEDKKTLLSHLIATNPRVILIEAVNIDSEYLSFLLLLKSHEKLKATILIAIFPDESNLQKHSDVFSFGIQYGFIAGEEIQKILSDINYFSSLEKRALEKFATANRLTIHVQVGHNAKVSHLSPRKICIETSVNLIPDDIIAADIFLDQNFFVPSYRVLSENTFFPRSFFFEDL